MHLQHACLRMLSMRCSAHVAAQLSVLRLHMRFSFFLPPDTKRLIVWQTIRAAAPALSGSVQLSKAQELLAGYAYHVCPDSLGLW